MWPKGGWQPDCQNPQTYSAFHACSRSLAGAHKKKPNREGLGFEYGGQSRNRTKDTRIFNPLLYQLS